MARRPKGIITDDGRECSKCGSWKPWSEFYRNAYGRAGHASACKECWAVGTSPNYKQRVKREVMEAYGGACACCGETRLAFLTIDHINQDGAEHRRQLRSALGWAEPKEGRGGGGGYAFYLHLRREGYPPGYQVLCWNCNSGRAVNGGICPHQEEAA